MFSLRKILSLIAILLLVGCNSIEHRSEKVIKVPLKAIHDPKIVMKPIWSNNQSRGISTSDAKLKIAHHNNVLVIADYKGKIYAFDAQSGKAKWQALSQKGLTAGPNVTDGKVLLGTEDGHLYAYNFTDGKPLYNVALRGPILASPMGESGMAFVNSLDGSVIGLNIADGQELWVYNSRLPALLLRRSSSPAFYKQQILVGLANGKLIALDKKDGTVEWEREIGISKGRSDLQRMVDISADPLVKDNIVYVVSYQGRIAALQAENGNPLWEKEMSSYSGLAVGKSTLFVTDPQGIVWALNRQTGKVVWQQGDLGGRQLTAPMILDNAILVGDEEGHIHFFSLQTGELIGRTKVGSNSIETMLVQGDHLYVLGKNGKLSAFVVSFLSDKGK